MFKGWKARSYFKSLKQAQITISSNFRGFRHRRQYRKIKSAQILIASYVRMWKCRKVCRLDVFVIYDA